MQSWTRILVVFAVGLGLMVAAAPAHAATPPDPNVVAAFNDLVAYIETIPESQLNRGQKNAFSQRLANAQRLYEQGQVCAAANILDAHLNQSQALRKGSSAPAAEQLYARGRSLRAAVLRSAQPSDPCAEASLGRLPAVQINASDNRHFSARINFGSPELSSVTGGGETWTQMSLPGIENLIGAAGRPAVPSFQALIGVPRGASVRLATNRATTREQILVNLYPFQKQAADQDSKRFADEPLPPDETFMDPPFVKDQKAYDTPGFWPPDPCAVRIIDNLRDIVVAQIQCHAGQYNPATDQMNLYSSVEFDVAFDGGTGKFATTQTLSPFEPASSAVVGSVLNSTAVNANLVLVDPSRLPCWGEELLILTHPNFRAAADDLAEWKNTKGITTNVFEVGSGTAFTTGAQIDNLIENRYNRCAIRPSYVLLIGDSEFVPPAKLDHNTLAACDGCGDMTNGSDWWYATYSGSLFGFLPWFGVSRIPVDSAAEAQTVVDKSIQYESNPPFLGFTSGAPFYTTAMNASYFQCCRTDVAQAGRDMRTFVQTSETVRNAMTSAGYTVERIYNTNTDYQDDPVADTTPRRYYDGTGLPAALAPGTFTWNGATANIINAFNNGRFLILHRDHGGSTAWSDPSFSTTNLASLTNGGLLPFVFSVNCASGFWDRETDSGGTTESLMERLLMQSGGGMVAGLGDNRNSPTWANSALTRGFYDALWPSVAPEFSTSTVKRRLADILDHGKIYLLTQYGVAQPAGSISLDAVVGQWVMWHAFGDPTAEIWTGNPHGLILPVVFTLMLETDHLAVRYDADGATITAYQQAEEGLVPIGRGTVVGGLARFPFFVAPDPQKPIILSASHPSAVSVLLTRGQLPDLVVDALTLTSMILTTGQDLSGGTLRVKVGNIGGALALGTLKPDGTVRGPGIGYMVDLVLSSDMVVPPGFAVVPLPAGVAYVEDGLLQGGRVSRTPDVPAGAHFDLPTVPPISGDVGGVIPLQAPVGDLFLCARIDPGNAVAESNEANNVTCVRVKVTRPTP